MKSVFKFLSTPKAYGHYIVTDIILFYDNQGICSLYKSCYSANCHQPPPSLPRRITHPDLPQGKEQVTLPIVISPHLTSPEGEGQIPLAILLLACSRLIVSDLSTTRATSINLSLTEPEQPASTSL